METRQKIEYKIYYLALSDMRGNVDRTNVIACFDDLEKLKNWYNKQVGPWVDKNGGADNFGKVHDYQKHFLKGSPLEWYNSAISLEPKEHPDFFGGVGYQWVENLQFRIPFNPA